MDILQAPTTTGMAIADVSEIVSLPRAEKKSMNLRLRRSKIEDIAVTPMESPLIGGYRKHPTGDVSIRKPKSMSSALSDDNGTLVGNFSDDSYSLDLEDEMPSKPGSRKPRSMKHKQRKK
jgi:hypothetical protein